jgi:DNA-binding MarR family transcriptional regulator
MKDMLLCLDNQICHRIYALNNALTRKYRPLLKKIGLTYPQYVVMMTLWEKDNIMMQDLAHCSKMDPGSLSVILKKLAEKKIIKFSEAKNDKRKKYVVLTVKGNKLKEKALSVPEKMGCYLKTADLTQIENLKKILDDLYHDFSVEGKISTE